MPDSSMMRRSGNKGKPPDLPMAISLRGNVKIKNQSTNKGSRTKDPSSVSHDEVDGFVANETMEDDSSVETSSSSEELSDMES
ncbi:hypothetical protein Syun_021325 [Stephania yunnanensis]|uniref:Uncharacterized protein n=1 Tax=Stephania yunnanensis TaxID=152371 RepID=A0AAP0IGE0_9MAGN